MRWRRCGSGCWLSVIEELAKGVVVFGDHAARRHAQQPQCQLLGRELPRLLLQHGAHARRAALRAAAAARPAAGRTPAVPRGGRTSAALKPRPAGVRSKRYRRGVCPGRGAPAGHCRVGAVVFPSPLRRSLRPPAAGRAAGAGSGPAGPRWASPRGEDAQVARIAHEVERRQVDQRIGQPVQP